MPLIRYDVQYVTKPPLLLQEVGIRALKLSGNKSIDAALEVIQKLNGFTKTNNCKLQMFLRK